MNSITFRYCCLITACYACGSANGFSAASLAFLTGPRTYISPGGFRVNMSEGDGGWDGEITTSKGGKINGCSIVLKDGALTEWTVTIDGVEADLGRFSEAIYKKITADARQQRFQGFRPGTIPPHLEPTYRAFAMDECARETAMEALQQNSIRPFEQTRSELKIEQVSIPPTMAKKKKKKKRRKKAVAADATVPTESEPEWRLFENMKGAVDAGWKPGQSFSFVATNVSGQQVKSEEETRGANPLGLNY